MVSRSPTENPPFIYKLPNKLPRILIYYCLGSSAGDPSVIKWAADFTNTVFQPAYSDFEILLSGGNTDAWKKVVGLLSEQGDKILVEAHTYPSSQALWIPMGCEAVPVKVDSHGMRSDDMDAILTSWEANNPGVKKPHL